MLNAHAQKLSHSLICPNLQYEGNLKHCWMPESDILHPYLSKKSLSDAKFAAWTSRASRVLAWSNQLKLFPRDIRFCFSKESRNLKCKDVWQYHPVPSTGYWWCVSFQNEITHYWRGSDKPLFICLPWQNLTQFWLHRLWDNSFRDLELQILPSRSLNVCSLKHEHHLLINFCSFMWEKVFANSIPKPYYNKKSLLNILFFTSWKLIFLLIHSFRAFFMNISYICSFSMSSPAANFTSRSFSLAINIFCTSSCVKVGSDSFNIVLKSK